MRFRLLRTALVGAAVLAAGCQSAAVREKCAGAADPAACEQAEYGKLRDLSRQNYEQPNQSGGGSGGGY